MRFLLIFILLLSICASASANCIWFPGGGSAWGGSIYDITVPEDIKIGETREVKMPQIKYSSHIKCGSQSGLTFISPFKYGRPPVIGFRDGTYLIKVEVSNMRPKVIQKYRAGVIEGITLNASPSLKFTRLATGKPTKLVKEGGVADYWYFIVGLVSIDNATTDRAINAGKIDGGEWKANSWNDALYTQVLFHYTPKRQTCQFNDVVVRLPIISPKALADNATKLGYTPFTMKMNCDDLDEGHATSDIKIFISSEKLQGKADGTVLVDNKLTGVGVSLVYNNSPNPIGISSNPQVIGPKTTIIKKINDRDKLDKETSFNFGAYYVKTGDKVSIGHLNTSATINILYE